MKTFKISLLSFLCLLVAQVSMAQSKTEKFAVSGNCGMCKSKIETSAKKAGATAAFWSEETKELTVSYNSTSANAAKIQQAIAAVGYDTPRFKATDESYEKLHSCCKYDRTTAAKESTCCAGKTCTKEECKTCCVDGKCTTNGACCTEGTSGKESVLASGAKAEGAACCKKS